MKYAAAVLLMAVTASPMAHAAPAATAPAPKFTVETPIETLVADPKAKAALDANFPGLTENAMYDQFKTMSLKQMQPMAGDKITDEALAKLTADLAAIK